MSLVLYKYMDIQIHIYGYIKYKHYPMSFGTLNLGEKSPKAYQTGLSMISVVLFTTSISFLNYCRSHYFTSLSVTQLACPNSANIATTNYKFIKFRKNFHAFFMTISNRSTTWHLISHLSDVTTVPIPKKAKKVGYNWMKARCHVKHQESTLIAPKWHQRNCTQCLTEVPVPWDSREWHSS